MILVDSRVGSKELVEPLAKKLNGQVKSCVLEYGDCAWEGSHEDGTIAVGLELKKLGDILASMRSGRYVLQMKGMAGMYSICYLMIEGSYAPSNEGLLCTPTRGGWAPLNLQSMEQRERGRRRAFYSYAELDKFLASLEVLENVIVRKSCNRLDTVTQIADLFNWWQRPWNQHDSTKAIKLQSGLITRRASLCRMVAAQLPGVGYELAGHLEKHFRTTERLINANPSEISAVSWKTDTGRKNSIGDTRAMNIYQKIREDEVG